MIQSLRVARTNAETEWIVPSLTDLHLVDKFEAIVIPVMTSGRLGTDPQQNDGKTRRTYLSVMSPLAQPVVQSSMVIAT